jgi:hypothetical protein
LTIKIEYVIIDLSKGKQRKEVPSMTKREMFVAIANVAEVAANEEMVNFINHEIELLDNRKSGKKGQTKTQKENEGIKAVIAEVLNESGEKKTVTELIADERLNGYTNQKISALLRQMVEAGRVNKSIEGKKAYFEAVSAEE